MKQRIPQSVILEIRAYRKLRDTDKQEDIIHPSPVTTFTLPHTLPTVIRHRIPQFEKNEVTCTSGVYMYPCAWEMKHILLCLSVPCHTCPGDLSTSMWVPRDNSTFPQHYSHVWWRIGVSRKFSPGNYCTVGKISGEFTKALKMTFLGLKTIYIFIIHTKE